MERVYWHRSEGVRLHDSADADTRHQGLCRFIGGMVFVCTCKQTLHGCQSVFNCVCCTVRADAICYQTPVYCI